MRNKKKITKFKVPVDELKIIKFEQKEVETNE